MTQTTRERILNLLVNGDGKTFAGSGDDYRLHGPADAIAAEIDFTAAQRDGAYVAHNEVNDDLIRARKQVENLFGALAVCTNERDTLCAELAEARAEVATLTLKLANSRLNVGFAEAEVERLRPAAEAWEALMVLRDAEMGSTSVGLNLARDAYGAAANRARAANGDTLAHEAALKSAHVRGDA